MAGPRSKLTVALASVSATAALFAAAPSQAHKLPPTTAKSVAAKAAAKTARQTGARSSKVLGCFRQSAHKFLCRADLYYSQGASRCSVDITVAYASSTSGTTRSRVGATRCF